MAKCNLSAKELTVETFSPRVAVLCSPVAQTICDKNNLKFTQLIQPFTTFTATLNWREPNGGQIFPKNLKITPVDLSTWKPPESDAAKNRNIQYSVVSQCLPPTQQLIRATAPPGCRAPPPKKNSYTSSDNIDLSLQQLLLKKQKLGKKESGISSTDYDVSIPPSTPWFEIWRETFLKHFIEQQANQYEFLSQFIACVLVISSCEGKTSDELGTIVGKLSKLQHQHHTEWPSTWFLPSVLKYYIILHDNSGPQTLADAESNYQVLRSMYGGSFCYMLKINSGNKEEQSLQDPWTYFINQEQHLSESSPDVIEATEQNDSSEVFNFTQIPHPLSPDTPSASKLFLPNGGQNIHPEQNEPGPSHSKVPTVTKSIIRGQYMTPEDLQSIQTTINEFWGKSLFPYIERQCRLLHESIVNRRSMSKSFFGATKRLFGSSSKTPGAIVYPLDSSEMITRKLADLYFLFGHYAGAYQLYHQLKKDFQADAAWPYYAYSLEMAAVSHFMMTQTDANLAQGARSFPAHYIQEAIRCYLENCRMTDAAIRCAIICCECLKQLDNYAEAATVLIRMTSGECDLRSALMLEQAAYAFIQLNSPRKYALHSVLAGHRFNKAGLKYHSLNSYLQAGKVFFGRGWRLAEDHIHFTIGKHQSFLSLHTGLAEHFKSLLRYPTPPSPAQVELYYKEFLQVSSKLHDENKLVQELFIPKIISSDIKIRIGSTGLPTGELPVSAVGESGSKSSNSDNLEEQVVKDCIDNAVILFKPSRLLFDSTTDNTQHPTVPCDECFYVEIPIHNPLLIPLTLSQIGLSFEPVVIAATATSSLVNELSLLPDETKYVRIDVTGTSEGKLSFDWLHYELRLGAVSVPFKQCIKLKGPRLHIFKAERGTKLYVKDLRNRIHIVEQMPLLQAEIEGLPPSLFQSQTTNFNIVLHDKSKSQEERQRISQIILATENMSEFLQINNDITTTLSNLTVGKIHKNYCPINLNLRNDNGPSPTSLKIPCIFKAPPMIQSAQLNILILYQVRPNPNTQQQQLQQQLQDDSDGILAIGFKPRIMKYRVIKVAINIPLLPSLRLDYTYLKPINSLEFLGLLKVENIMQMGVLEIEKIEFGSNDNYAIQETITKGQQGCPHQKLKVCFSESRNIILKVQETRVSKKNSLIVLNVNEGERPEGESLFICLSWSFSNELNHTNNNINNNKVLAVGTYRFRLSNEQLLKSTLPLVPPIINDEEKRFHFIVKHTSQTSHDFNESPCFILPVILEVYSCWSGKANLTITTGQTNMLDPAESEQPNLIEPDTRFSSSSGVIFVGQTKWTLDLSEFECQSLHYNVAITRPGVYNVAPKITLTLLQLNNEGNLVALEESDKNFILHNPLIVAHKSSSSSSSMI